jgi:hypothetical protein
MFIKSLCVALCLCLAAVRYCSRYLMFITESGPHLISHHNHVFLLAPAICAPFVHPRETGDWAGSPLRDTLVDGELVSVVMCILTPFFTRK